MSDEAGTRIEEDLLGSKEIPADAYYGIHTARALENFHISGRRIQDFPEFVRGMVLVKKAEALANAEMHVLEPEIADLIVRACDEVLDRGRCMDQFPIDVFQGGAGTSVNMNTNEVLANLALELMGRPKGDYRTINPNDHVNKSQSTNDSYPTGFRIALHRMITPLVEALGVLAGDFRHLAEKYADSLKMGRTQLQDAVPMTVGEEFEAFAVLMEEEIRHVRREAALLLEVNLGATAIGTGLNTPEGFQDLVTRRLAEVSGLPVVAAPNLVEATSDTGAYIAVHGSLKRVASKLSKVCNDLRLLSSGPRAGLKEINLPEMQAGSSIMPAKVNPVIPEVVNQVCFTVMGNDVTVEMAAEAGQLQLNVMEPGLAQAMFESLTLLTNALRTLREKCIVGITANEEHCREMVLNSIGIVTLFNDLIGHHMGDEVGREAARTGKSVRQILLERKLLDEAQIDSILTPQNLLHPEYKGVRYSPEDRGLPARA